MFSVYHEHCYNMVAKTKETQSSNEIWDFRGLEQHRWDCLAKLLLCKINIVIKRTAKHKAEMTCGTSECMRLRAKSLGIAKLLICKINIVINRTAKHKAENEIWDFRVYI